MEDRPTTPPPSPVTLAELVRRYGGEWEIIAHATDLPVWTAEHRSGDGRSIRYIVAHSPAELAAKLESAGTVEP